jgi:hypothetical protein
MCTRSHLVLGLFSLMLASMKPKVFLFGVFIYFEFQRFDIVVLDELVFRDLLLASLHGFLFCARHRQIVFANR